MQKQIKILSMLLVLFLSFFPGLSIADDKLKTSAIMTTDLVGESSKVAIPSVFRVIIPKFNRAGTSFYHKSGNVITAAHIVESASANDIMLIDYQGSNHKVSDIIIDEKFDLAILKLERKINIPSIEIASRNDYPIGLQVSTWGYPEGYSALAPLLMSGYLSGTEVFDVDSKEKISRWVVNAAFNNGNSGGPLIDIEKGKVIGVVVSKLAPLPHDIELALNALKTQKAGFIYEKTYTDGRKEKVTEAQTIEEVLQYLRRQTQLVVGYAVMNDDLKYFLKMNGIKP